VTESITLRNWVRHSSSLAARQYEKYSLRDSRRYHRDVPESHRSTIRVWALVVPLPEYRVFELQAAGYR
jgi:hypothetical protein